MNESKFTPLSSWDVVTITMAIRTLLREERIDSDKGKDLLKRLEQAESIKVKL